MMQGVREALYEAGRDSSEFIDRHQRLEQGELCEDDHKANLFSVDREWRIFSSFKTNSA